MTPEQQIRPPARLPDSSPTFLAARTASTICLILGCWYFVSPWVYGALPAASWNCWIAGGYIIFFSSWRVAKTAYSTGLSWFVMVGGAWIAASPWIYEYVGDTEFFLNSLVLGLILFVLSIYSAFMSMRSNVPGMAQVH